MDHLNDYRNLITIVHTLALIAIGLTVWLRKPGEEAKHEVAELKETVGALKGDMRVVQQELKHLPTRQEMAELSRSLGQLETQTEAQNRTLDTMRISLTRIENYLLEHGR